MARKIDSFHQMLVRKVGGTEELKLTFVNRSEMLNAKFMLQRKGFEIVDYSPGYKLYRKAEDCIHDVEVFCRR